MQLLGPAAALADSEPPATQTRDLSPCFRTNLRARGPALPLGTRSLATCCRGDSPPFVSHPYQAENPFWYTQIVRPSYERHASEPLDCTRASSKNPWPRVRADSWRKRRQGKKEQEATA